jgi:hypothetical protein
MTEKSKDPAEKANGNLKNPVLENFSRQNDL